MRGIDPANMDLRVDPGADFYRYANGGWLEQTEIPDTRADVGALADLGMHTHYQLLFLLVKQAEENTAAPGSDEWKAARLYDQGTDLESRNAAGVAPIQPILDQIEAIDDLAALHSFFEGSVFLSESALGLFAVSAAPDLRDSTQTVAYLGGPPIALPPAYYVQDDATSKAVRETYVSASAELLTLAGDDPARARAAARAVLTFETALAEPVQYFQDPAASYHPTTTDALNVIYPLQDWPHYLAALGLPDTSQLIVTQPRYLTTLAATVRETPLQVIKDELRLQLLWSASSTLSEAFQNAAFPLDTALTGTMEQSTVMDQTFSRVDAYLGDVLGQIYVAQFFSPEAKAQSTELVQELVDAFRQRLEQNVWLSPATKARALEKLATLRIEVGYPDHWHDYADVQIGDSYFASVVNASNASYRDRLAQVGKPVDRSAWAFSPQTVNAMYDPVRNAIVLPAAILQPPYFDPAADPAANYGAIGFVIGHEISHAFDLQGAEFDAQGNLHNWWTDADRTRFETLNERVIAQYSQIEVLDGVTVNGALTVTENVADLGGLQVAYDALERHLAEHGRPLPPPPATEAAVDSYLTQEQRFFVAAATVWREEIRDEALRTQVVIDPHAPAAVRATQSLRNCDAFYTAFDIDPSDPMYLPPEDRIVVW